MSNNKIIELSGHCKNLTGCRFGRLVVLFPVGKDKRGAILWKCQCNCGQECVVRSDCLLCGETRSCGCLQKEIRVTSSRTHGMCHSPEYHAWHDILQRCKNPDCKSFPDYGGRGIKVCKRWNSFENFYEDMRDRPEGKSIDRINNNGDYEPGNCKWSTPHEQMMNRRPVSKGPFKQRWFRAWRSDMMCQFLSNNQGQFARDHSLNPKCISACLLGKAKSHRDWSFRRILSPQV